MTRSPFKDGPPSAGLRSEIVLLLLELTLGNVQTTLSPPKMNSPGRL